MITGFIKGFTAYIVAFRFILKHSLYKHFIISGLISLAIGLSIFGLAYGMSDNIGHYLTNLYPFETGASYLASIITVLSGGAIGILGLLIFKYILLICISPFMGPLSAKVESIITQEDLSSKFSITQVSYEMIRGFRIAARNISREIFFTLFLMLLGFIPLITIFITPLILLIQSYYAGFSNFDYFLERRTNVSESVQYNKTNRGQTSGNGLAFLLLLFIPVLGLFFAPVLGTVAATITALKSKDIPNIKG